MTVHGHTAEHQPGTQKAYQAEGMEYYLYVPPGEPPPEGWPIILFTHGIGEASQNYSNEKNQWVQQSIDVVKRHGSPPSLCETQSPEADRLRNSFIVISPQFPFAPTEKQKAQRQQGRTWQWAERVSTIDHILGVVTKKFNGNPKRIYATGFSRGGRGALALAQQLKKHTIAKLVLVDSESGLSELPNIPTWIHYGGPRTLGNIVHEHQALSKRLGNAVWNSAPPSTSAPAGQHLFTDWHLNFPERGQTHTKTSRRAYSDPRVYEWLLAQP